MKVLEMLPTTDPRTLDDAIVVSVGIGIALLSRPAARAITRRLYRRIEARVSQLTEVIAAKVRESVEDQ